MGWKPMPRAAILSARCARRLWRNMGILPMIKTDAGEARAKKKHPPK